MKIKKVSYWKLVYIIITFFPDKNEYMQAPDARGLVNPSTYLGVKMLDLPCSLFERM